MVILWPESQSQIASLSALSMGCKKKAFFSLFFAEIFGNAALKPFPQCGPFGRLFSMKRDQIIGGVTGSCDNEPEIVFIQLQKHNSRGEQK